MTLESPASASPLASLERSDPLVVRATSKPNEEIWLTSLEMSLLRRGSPQVILTLLSPSGLHAITKFRICSYDSMLLFGKKLCSLPNFSLGMQYLHLKLHLSVTETLRSLRGLPNLSSATSVRFGLR